MKKVLVVDDNPETLLLVQILLDRHGFLVESVTHASLLEKKIKQFDPGLLIIDVNLQDGDGRLICRNLKSDPDTAHIPIILFSADPAFNSNLHDYCADGFITKPIDARLFVDNVNRFFNRRTSLI
jgi:DNA-binding response OmpR family regulator